MSWNSVTARASNATFMKDASASHLNSAGVADLLSRKPPNSPKVSMMNEPTTLATALEGARMPISMHTMVADTLARMRTPTNHATQLPHRGCRPIIGYVNMAKKNGGTTRSGRMSNKTTAVK